MIRGDFIPPISDYEHWNEDAARMWYEENKYDMQHWDEPVEDYDDPYNWYDEEIPEGKCWELNRHQDATSGRIVPFGPNADTLVFVNEWCQSCGTALSEPWTPPGYHRTEDEMVVYREEFTRIGRKVTWLDRVSFAVFERKVA